MFRYQMKLRSTQLMHAKFENRPWMFCGTNIFFMNYSETPFSNKLFKFKDISYQSWDLVAKLFCHHLNLNRIALVINIFSSNYKSFYKIYTIIISQNWSSAEIFLSNTFYWILVGNEFIEHMKYNKCYIMIYIL